MEKTKRAAVMRRILVLFTVLLAFGAVTGSSRSVAQTAEAVDNGRAEGTRHALLIGGLGGTPEYTQKFGAYLGESRSLLVDRFGFDPDRVHVLAEQALGDRSFVDGLSSAEKIREVFAGLERSVGSNDHLYVLLFGHGSYDGTNAKLNIPRQDLADFEYGELLDGVDAGRIVFINTSSASGPFATAVGGPNRIVITATATGTERDETLFPHHFVDALRVPDADLDKNGALSVREAFIYAVRQTVQSFENAGQLLTEHALLEDNGDGKPSRLEELENGEDGHLAALTYFRPPDERRTASAEHEPIFREIRDLEQAIADLKSRKQRLDEERYYAELEALFVRLARLNDQLDADG